MNEAKSSPILPTLGIQRFQLMIKLLFFKYGYETNSYLPQQRGVKKLNTFDQLFQTRIKDLNFSKQYIKECRRILEINVSLNNNAKFSEYRGELQKYLPIEPDFIIPYSYDDEGSLLTPGSSRIKLLFEYAKAVAQFKPQQDILQPVEFDFEKKRYSITPMSVAIDLNCPPFTEEFYSLRTLYNLAFDYAVTFDTLVAKFLDFMKTPCSQPIKLPNKKPLTEDAIIRHHSMNLNEQPPSKPTSAVTEITVIPFNLTFYVPLQPTHPINTRGRAPEVDELNTIIGFANFPILFDRLQATALTSTVISQYGELMLKSACYHSNIRVVKRLLDSKIDPFKNDANKIPVLLCVAMGGSIEIFDMLVTDGNIITQSIYLDYSIYDIAILIENYALAVHIQNKFPYEKYIGIAGYDTLSIAMAMRNLHAIIALPALHKVIPTQQHFAFAWDLGQIKCLEMFYMKAAETDLTPIQLLRSIYFNYISLVEILLKRKCDPNLVTQQGDLAISLAISQGQLQIVKLLLQFKADPNLPNPSKVTPMIHAAAQGSTKIMQALIDAGGDLRVEHEGLSLFEIVIIYKHAGLARHLINKGYFSPNQLSTTRKTYFEMILQYVPKIELIKTCLQTSNIQLTTASGISLVEYALKISCRAEIIVELLKTSVPNSEESDRILQLIATHPERQLIADSLPTKEKLVTEQKLTQTLTVTQNRFTLLFTQQAIPTKDWPQMSTYDNDPNIAIELYRAERLKLIAELTNWYDIIQQKFPEIILKLPDIDQYKLTAPNRSLQAKIIRLRAMVETTPASLLRSANQSLFAAPRSLEQDNATFFADRKPIAKLGPILGLTMVANHFLYALVTQQLTTLIYDYSEDRLAPFLRILASPIISNRNGLKDIRARNITATVTIDNVEYTLPVSFYLKVKKIPHRILVAQLTPMSGHRNLLIPVHWLNNGFHDDRYAGKTHFRGGYAVTTAAQEEIVHANSNLNL